MSIGPFSLAKVWGIKPLDRDCLLLDMESGGVIGPSPFYPGCP